MPFSCYFSLAYDVRIFENGEKKIVYKYDDLSKLIDNQNMSIYSGREECSN